MNKEKFANKCREMCAYEDEILAMVKDYFKDKVVDLNEKGLCVDICLEWLNYRVYDDSNENLPYLSRIAFNDGYQCELFFQIRRSEDPFPDWDLISIWSCLPITNIYTYSIFWKHLIRKTPLRQVNKWMKYLDGVINDVLQNGYDKVLNCK